MNLWAVMIAILVVGVVVLSIEIFKTFSALEVITKEDYEKAKELDEQKDRK